MDERIYRALKYTAIVFALAWVAWSFYDGFIRARSPADLTLAAAEKAFADGRYEAAREDYRELLENDPGHIEARRGLARTLMETGDHGAALRHYDRAISAARDFAPTYANRGILHDRMGRYRKAIEDYRRALELDPSLDEGPGWLTRFLRNQAEAPPTIGDRAEYLAAEMEKPPDERLLRVPDEDARQRSYRK